MGERHWGREMNDANNELGSRLTSAFHGFKKFVIGLADL
jgi:hypothetical protein